MQLATCKRLATQVNGLRVRVCGGVVCVCVCVVSWGDKWKGGKWLEDKLFDLPLINLPSNYGLKMERRERKGSREKILGRWTRPAVFPLLAFSLVSLSPIPVPIAIPIPILILILILIFILPAMLDAFCVIARSSELGEFPRDTSGSRKSSLPHPHTHTQDTHTLACECVCS